MKFQKNRLITFFLENMIWILLILVILLFSLMTPRYLTKTNLINILVHASVLGIMVVGQSIVLISGNFDLSMESTLGFTALIGAWLVTKAGAPSNGSGLELNPFLGIAAMFLVALMIGLWNGFLITKLKINNFIATLAMLIILRGLILVVTEGNTITRMPKVFTALGRSEIAGNLPLLVVVMVLSYVIAQLVMRFLQFGRDIYAVGGNREAALASGIDPDKRIRQAYVASALLAALAGLVLVGRLNSFPANMGQNMGFEVFAAAVIGGISLQGGRGNMVGAFGGVLLLAAIDSGLNLMRVNSFWIDTIRGLVILAAMFIDAQKLRYKTPQVSAKIRTITPSKSVG